MQERGKSGRGSVIAAIYSMTMVEFVRLTRERMDDIEKEVEEKKWRTLRCCAVVLLIDSGDCPLESVKYIVTLTGTPYLFDSLSSNCPLY